MGTRQDNFGFWWQDLPSVKKPKKEIIKRTPPDPVWLLEGYLPGLQEAQAFPVEAMSDLDIMVAHQTQDRFLYDTEVYPNYFCGIFRSLKTGKALVFEMHLDPFERLDYYFDEVKFRWIIENITTVTFNGIHFDLPITAMALDGYECDSLKQAANDLIQRGMRNTDIYKNYKVKPLKCDHIDLIQVAPLQASLKTYGGRLHVPRMQDLPFHESTVLTMEQIAIVRWYCVNDTTSTGFLHECLAQQIDLRYTLSNETRIDLRSKSDAQIAEQIIANDYQKRTGVKPTRPLIVPGTIYHYTKPYSLNFQTPLMQRVLEIVQEAPFEVDPNGYIELPESVKKLKFQIGDSIYQMGAGGLHSTEKTAAHHTDDFWQLRDMDVASYYPKLILNNNYFPEHLGPTFLEIFGSITARRLRAKAAGYKAIADSLKIVINGTFGKLASMWSIMYAPRIMFHVTVGGQLFLLMLIEALELAGIKVVSGNTDGIMVKCPKHMIGTLKHITEWWERTTGFETESKNYRSIYSRDINNYIAIDEHGEIKHKGAYANPWNDPKENPEKKLHKNPVTTVCIEAVDAYLRDGTPLEDSIWKCKDIRKFVRIQSVTGGAVKNGEYLGKSIRWYYAAGETGEIVKALNGNKVGKSDGGRPLLRLPEVFPDDINYDWYLAECKKILQKIGAMSSQD